MMSLEEKLQSEIQEIKWDALLSHGKRGGLILVDAKLDLVTAAIAVAEDQIQDVTTFLQSGLMHKPSDVEMAALGEEGNPVFRFIVVQPFVLASRKGDEVKDLN